MANLQTIINKIVTEQDFREALVNDPAGTLQEAGVEPTVQMLAAFEALDLNILKADIDFYC